jgi:hypothetical protein
MKNRKSSGYHGQPSKKKSFTVETRHIVYVLLSLLFLMSAFTFIQPVPRKMLIGVLKDLLSL